eukprot:TRINITY_DN62504_c0_g1_i2.p1 TRINITY_DN62504_c0_g1~~TRINITY_DN62504_c0_g1_i2.p1  ORF type:complete len:289 (+),score=67.56 TRINITY_DN62504_c0_g1_i2:129-995(+)
MLRSLVGSEMCIRDSINAEYGEQLTSTMDGTPLSSSQDPQTSPFHPHALKSRVALITGGGSGIGFGIAKSLGMHGAAVCIMGRRANFLESAAASLRDAGVERVICVSGDVRKEEDCQRVVAQTVQAFGSIDTLVNCAAGNFLSTAEGLTSKGFRTVLEIDTVGVFNMCSAGFESLRDSGRGVILNISTPLHFAATWYQTHACAAKAAIDSITRQLALEWGDFRIRVCSIAPGPIADTPGMLKLSGGTVSYTHLRAHETPEHLVCRLLLEKKNRTQQSFNHLHIYPMIR